MNSNDGRGAHSNRTAHFPGTHRVGVAIQKARSGAGIDTLLRLGELTPESVDRVLIAGSFGYHLRPQNLVSLGLLPAAFAGKIEFVGNTSKTGAQAFLLDRLAREEMAQVVQETPTADLAHAPNFEKIFVEALAFPNFGGNRTRVSLA